MQKSRFMFCPQKPTHIHTQHFNPPWCYSHSLALTSLLILSVQGCAKINQTLSYLLGQLLYLCLCWGMSMTPQPTEYWKSDEKQLRHLRGHRNTLDFGIYSKLHAVHADSCHAKLYAKAHSPGCLTQQTMPELVWKLRKSERPCAFQQLQFKPFFSLWVKKVKLNNLYCVALVWYHII